MKAGTGKIDITPGRNVLMDGMIREHASEGVHDPISARALVLANDEDMSKACAIVSVEVCGISEEDSRIVRDAVHQRAGIPRDRIVLAATHTHSGPSTVGYFNPVETEYVKDLRERLVKVIEEAAANMRPALAGCASGEEHTISHYRRLLADDGHVVMNWEPFPAERIVKVLGEADPEVGVLKVVDAESPDEVICILFNHAGHPNVLSGDNYLISSDYPGYAANLLEEEIGCVAMFVNAAEGTMDIDGLKDRDWEGVVRAGTALAEVVSNVAKSITDLDDLRVNGSSVGYTIGKRKITDEEVAWFEAVLEKSDGSIQTMADGVGDDYKAMLYKKIHDSERDEIDIEQICIAVGDAAFVSFPGEVFTEIGMHIKAESPFAHTYFMGMVNGKVGYIPTRKAISEGGYAVDTRELDTDAEDALVQKSLTLLNEVYEQYQES